MCRVGELVGERADSERRKAERGNCIVNMTVVKRGGEKEQDEQRDATVNET